MKQLKKICEKCTNKTFCLKIITKNEQYFHQSLIEINILKYLNETEESQNYYSLKLIEYFYLNGNLYIITEILGQSLYQKFIANKQTPSIIQLKKLVRDILLNLQFLKKQKIIHCDIKPENIVLDKENQKAKIIDFGSASFIDEVSQFYLQTRPYRAPEVVLGIQYDYQIDIWSLGCLLFEILKGQNLFDYESSIKNVVKAMSLKKIYDTSIFKNSSKLNSFIFQDKFFFLQYESDFDKLLLFGKKQEINFFSQISKNDALNDFISCCLEIDPQQRITVEEALKHKFVKNQIQIIS